MNRFDYSPALGCERLFMEGGQFFHLCTRPLEDRLLLRTNEEMDTALNFLALAAIASPCKLLAFALMNNHFHFVLEGGEPEVLAFYEDFRTRLAKYMARFGRFKDYMAAEPEPIVINDLKQLRDEIAYVIRNPFVDRTDVNLFSYRWCSGYLYFNGIQDLVAKGYRVCDDTLERRRMFTHGRSGEVDSRIMAVDGVALPSSFTDYERAMSFFENARQFVLWVMKNVESQVAIAKRAGEAIQLHDIEMQQVIFRLCREVFKASGPKELDPGARVQLMRRLKYDYNASNKQIARCLGVPVGTVNQVFPLNGGGMRQ